MSAASTSSLGDMLPSLQLLLLLLAPSLQLLLLLLAAPSLSRAVPPTGASPKPENLRTLPYASVEAQMRSGPG